MACYGYGTYSPVVRSLTVFQSRGGVVWGAGESLNRYLDDFTSGDTCAQVRADYDASINDFLWPSDTFIQVGSSFSKPTLGDTTWSDPASPSFDNRNFGFSLLVSVFVDDGAGSYSSVSRGKLNVSASIDSAPTCVPFGDGFNAPQSNYITTIEDDLTGTWPVVIQAAGTAGNIVGISFSMHNYEGSHVGYTGTDCCPPGPHCSGYDGSTYVYPDGMVYSPSFQMLVGYTDLDAQFCCLASGQGCVECGGAVGSVNPHFLIPPPADPEPVEEKSTAPTLEQFIKLSNHTFQFTRNFGRVKK